MDTLALILIAYLLGSVSFAVLVSRALGLPDPRGYGSSNPGATNVLRTGSKAAAALTLAGDAAKGWLAVFLTQRFVAGDAELSMAGAALAVVLGHMFPVFHRFRGGKGVATALGVLLALNMHLAAGTAATWVVIAAFFRMSSLAALISAAFAPFFCFLLYGSHPYTAAVAAIAVLLVFRHHANIRNLLAGKEGRMSRNGGQAGDGRG
jgi:acyl phosphate:glycerol-3-phosphate acyltransferase